MKKLISFILISFSTFSMAAIETNVLVSKQAKNVTGYAQGTNVAITECKYDVKINKYDNAEEELVIYVNANANAQTYVALRLRTKDVPLHDGVILTDKGNEVRYENGELYYKKSQVDDGPFHNDYKILKLKVSRDLKTIETAYLKDVFKNVMRKKTDGEMNCQF